MPYQRHLPMSEDYCRLRDHLISQGSDPSLLEFCCVNHDLLRRSKVGGGLLTMNQRVTGKKGFSKEFILAAKADVNILKVTPFNPKMYCLSRTKAGALDGLTAMLLRSKVPVVQPFLLQTAAGKKDEQNYRFIAFQSFKDGLIKLDSAQTEGYMVCGNPPEIVDVVTLFELQLREERMITGVMLDWELKWSAFKGADGVHRQTLLEATEVAQTFPMFAYQRLLKHGMVDPNQRVCCVVKNKCRPLPDTKDHKISFHFLFRICGTGVEHSLACKKMFGDIIPLLKTYKAFGRLPDDANLKDSWLGLDPAILHFNGPISTANSRKVKEDSLPFLQSEICFRRGVEEQRVPIPALTDDVSQRLKQFARASYTIPSFSANYSDQFLKSCAVQNEVSGNRTQTLGHQTTSQGGTRRRPPFDEKLLPGWYPTAKENVRFDTALPCLQKYADQLQTALQSDSATPRTIAGTHTSQAIAGINTSQAMAGTPTSQAIAGINTSQAMAGTPTSQAIADTPTSQAIADTPTPPVLAGTPTPNTSAPKVTCIRSTGIVCPYQLYMGKQQIHGNNGIFVGIIPGQSAVVYAKCSHCQFPSTRVIPSKVLTGGWIQVTEGDIKALLNPDTNTHIQGKLLLYPRSYCTLFLLFL